MDTIIAELQAECEALIEEYQRLVEARLLETINLDDINTVTADTVAKGGDYGD